MTTQVQNDQDHALARALDQASPVPDMPSTRLHAAAMHAFPIRKPILQTWGARVGVLAATVVLGIGGFMALQSFQASQKAMLADADAFAEQLLSETF